MTKRSLLAALRHLASLHERRQRGEDGFILLESIVALSLVTVLMGALTSFTITAVTATTELRARQGAVQVATSTMAMIESLPATDLVTGRDTASVTTQVAPATLTAQYGAAGALKVQSLLNGMTPATDLSAAAGAGASAALPTSANDSTRTTLNGVTYTTAIYLGKCSLLSATLTDCVTNGTGTAQQRVVLAVSWSNKACRSQACLYTTTTLINGADDPVFSTNRANPPSQPVVSNPGAQVSTIGASESLQLTVESGTGLAPHTWSRTAGALPTGLDLSTGGLITGTPTVLGGPTSVTVTVADVFGRTASATFTWTVVAPPTIVTPGPQSSNRGQALTLAVASDCPHAPCSWTATGVPAGLSIDATGIISGTPTTTGTSSVTVTVTDPDGATATTAAFAWTVVDPLVVASPGTLTATVGATVSVPVSYTCSPGPCTITLTGTVPGIGLSATTPVTTNNTTTTLSRPAGTGTVYLAGVVQSSAVTSGTSRSYTPGLSITSSSRTVTAANGAWTITTRPTLSAVGTRTVNVGAVTSVGIDYTCPATPCTLALGSTVPGIGLSTTANRSTANTTTSLTLTTASGTVYLTGLVGTTAVPSGSTTKAWTVGLTLTDANTATATATSSGTWTATRAPKIVNPGSQAVEPNQSVALQLAASCPNGGCTWSATARVGNDTTNYPVAISSTGRVTYDGLAAGSYTLTVTITDANRLTDTISFPVTSQTFALSIGNKQTTRPTSGTTTVTIDVASLISPTADGYAYTLTGAPSWLTIDADGLLTAAITSSSSSKTGITVTATSTASATSTVSTTFTWNLS